MWGFWLRRQKQEAGREGPVSRVDVKHVHTIRCIIDEHVGLLVTQAEARSWRGGTSFNYILKNTFTPYFLLSLNMWGFWLHRQKQEAGGEGPVSIIDIKHVYTIRFIIAEHVGLLVTQAEARSWRGGTSFTISFIVAETNVGLLVSQAEA